MLFRSFIGGAGIAVNSQDIVRYSQNYGGLLLAGALLCVPAVFRFYDRHKKNPVIILLLAVIFWYSVYFMASSAGNPFMYFKF